MKIYTRYKNSGISWIGDVPEHWNVVRNKNFIDEKDEVVGEKFGDYTLLSLTKGGVIARDVESGKGKFPKDFDSYKIVQPGNVIFCLFDVDETPRTVGLSSLKGMITGAYDVFEPVNINARYYTYYFLAVDDRKALRPLYTGLRKVVKKDRFLACKIPVPPLSEQKEIAEYLDKKTAQINELVLAKQKQIELLKEYKQSVIENVITGKMNKNSRMKDSGISWIGKIPENWNVYYLFQKVREHFISNKEIHHQNLLSLSYGRIIQKDINKTDGLLPESFDTYQIVENGNVVLRLTDLQNDHKSLRVGYATQEGIITSAYECLEVFDKSLYSKFFYYQLHSFDVKKMFYGMGGGLRQNISYNELRKIRIAYPPLSEQKEIVAYIEKKVASIDSQIASIENQIVNLSEYKQSLISDVVTGKVKVC